MPDSLRQFKATVFQALAHPTRIAILEMLRDGELPVGVIVERLGVEPANASQHFAVLRARHILTSRKEGSQVFYTIRDPLIGEILDLMRRYFQAHLEESLAMLKDSVRETDPAAVEAAVEAEMGATHKVTSDNSVRLGHK